MIRTVTTNAPEVGVCAYCQKPSEGRHIIHRDGHGEGPAVDLCDACGSNPEPTCAEIWARIAETPMNRYEDW
jgi:hypothetical protein